MTDEGLLVCWTDATEKLEECFKLASSRLFALPTWEDEGAPLTGQTFAYFP